MRRIPGSSIWLHLGASGRLCADDGSHFHGLVGFELDNADQALFLETPQGIVLKEVDHVGDGDQLGLLLTPPASWKSERSAHPGRAEAKRSQDERQL